MEIYRPILFILLLLWLNVSEVFFLKYKTEFVALKGVYKYGKVITSLIAFYIYEYNS